MAQGGAQRLQRGQGRESPVLVLEGATGQAVGQMGLRLHLAPINADGGRPDEPILFRLLLRLDADHGNLCLDAFLRKRFVQQLQRARATGIQGNTAV